MMKAILLSVTLAAGSPPHSVEWKAVEPRAAMYDTFYAEDMPSYSAEYGANPGDFCVKPCAAIFRVGGVKVFKGVVFVEDVIDTAIFDCARFDKFPGGATVCMSYGRFLSLAEGWRAKTATSDTIGYWLDWNGATETEGGWVDHYDTVWMLRKR